MCCPFAAKPVSISIMSTGDVIEGKKFETVCSIDGIPVPNVTWLKDNLPHSSVENHHYMCFHIQQWSVHMCC